MTPWILDDENEYPELKPCPFCGVEPALKKDVRYPRPKCEPTDVHEVVCNTRGCVMYHEDNNYWLSPEAAIKAWNTRKGENKDGAEYGDQ